ncbi:alpha/beta-hydrolase [Heliocybe sulcata]|uniref:Alpha/beta-hydrolase n=1 Tax=Heliocybe sulcata TaxID=5364 RepID=A0A5C3NCM6_9AGAM|nr:alpha/beta-hydrolase [Heliocybe sulcata]
MGVNTFSAAVHITPVVIKTFLKHSKRKGQHFVDGDAEVATDDIFFDEAFHIVQAFLDLGTKNTLESFQAFTNTHVPAPPWAAVAPVVIPFKSCNNAADVLIDWFGPDDLKNVVGGERWWQVRGLDGIEAEWITEKEYLSDGAPEKGKKVDWATRLIKQMDHLESVMCTQYLTGGYFFGSINTHRYQIIRYARKMNGRAFVVNYRKAPQYPWPCPLQDVLASCKSSNLYLIQPPEGAAHKPVDPRKIVFAGDSAGGGLCVSALTVIRDMGLPMPGGAVLISPWVDLTHSFPSVMQNIGTDIIPSHGFMAKPSLVWPVDPLSPPGGRVIRTKTNPPPKPGHADNLKSDDGHAEAPAEDGVESQRQMLASGKDVVSPGLSSSSEQSQSGSGSRQEEHSRDGRPEEPNAEESHGNGRQEAGSSSQVDGEADAGATDDDDTDLTEPKPPKVLMHNPEETPLELRAQIQIYATNEQLTHPLVSPILQGSLGNLCPLYILVGDAEVLRDEGIYLAHRAAHPDEYPARHGVLKEGRRQKENAEKFRKPTKVHLQAYDAGMCHVLTVFTFTDSAKYAYRSIAQFIKHVTTTAPEEVTLSPFPELQRPPTFDDDEDDPRRRRPQLKTVKSIPDDVAGKTKVRPGIDSRTEFNLYNRNQAMAVKELKRGLTDFMPESESEGSSGNAKQSQEDLPVVLMIRERVDIHGKVRPMEPKEEVAALQLKPSEIGVIKEDPCRRWQTGQDMWDKKFKRTAERVVRKRQKNETKALVMLANARAEGLEIADDGSIVNLAVSPSRVSIPPERREIQSDRRWGPLDLEHESPPPSAICKRRDTPEALALLKKSIYYTAPATHRTMPKMRISQAIRASFDPNDHPTRPPRQSVSEQQVTHHSPIHGMSIWTGLLTLFMRKSSQKARDGRKKIHLAAKDAHDKLPISPSQ